MKVDVNEFIARYCGGDEYRHGLFVPRAVHSKLMRCQLSGEAFCEVSDNTIDLIEDARRKQELRDQRYNDVSCLRLAGMKAESDGDLEAAISRYAEAIDMGEASGFDLLHAYRHAYDRIIILLSRTHAHAREAQYIERLLKHDLQEADRQRLCARLEKTIAKIKK